MSKILNCMWIAVGWFVVSLLFSYVKSVNVTQIIKDIKQNLYASIHQKAMSEYVVETNEYYLNQFTKNIDILNENYLTPRCNIVSNILAAVISIATIFLIDWQLACAFVGVSLVTIVLSQLPGVLMAKKTTEFSKQNADYLKVVNTHLRGFEQIKLLRLGEIFSKNYLASDDNFEKSRFAYIFVTSMANVLGLFFSFFAQLACMAIGVWFVLRGDITVGLLISAINLLNGVFNPLQQFVQNKNLMGTVKEMMANYDTLLNPPISVQEHKESLHSPIRSIDIKDLSLSFGVNKTIFDQDTFHFEAGKKYAIVGESGRGKSTLAKILMQYFKPDQFMGEIYLNDQNARMIEDESIYQHIAYVQRNEFFVDGSVEDNILLDRQLDVPEGLYSQLKFSPQFLKKPMEEGSRNQVSAGEKQRIDMARFLVNDYDVYIFDEPTSNLDQATQDIVFDLLLRLEEKIVIVITHVHDPKILDQFDEVVHL